ncbi:MAG: hypothetical protein ACI9UN_003175 [Granulosicoccus sp.]|jgi:hypothetical protein
MNRRDFLARSIATGLAGLSTQGARLFAADNSGYAGELLVTLQAGGAWDVASYCDPKENQPGEMEITSWSRTNSAQIAGNIPYAPIANNQTFFEKYHPDMLVINGIDAQTNSHTTGVLHNWSGRNSPGYPSLTALFAANQAPDLPISYINFGGFSATADLIRFSRLDNLYALRRILNPLQSPGNPALTDRDPADIARLNRYRQARLQRIAEGSNYQRANLDAMSAALKSRSGLVDLKNFLPEQLAENEQVNQETSSSLRRQIGLTLAAFSSGLCCASDLSISGFDTHQNHDALHQPLLSHLNESIDFLWTEAEALGFADRLTVIIGSDFSRTPFYNSDIGKDHWPIGSTIVMRKDAPWANRVVGLTDEGQNAIKISPETLAADESGTFVYPKHVHQGLRTLMGLDDIAVSAGLAFNNAEHFDFFGA